MYALRHFIIAAACGLLPLAAGHIIMTMPTPYSPHTVQTSPLNVSAGLPFPCQGRLEVDGSATQITAGGVQTVKLSGAAVHGGGSCQFSINYGSPNSTNPADWKVIYTIIGGCPASGLLGNLPVIGYDADQRPYGLECGNATGTDCVRQFDIPIPKGLPNGNASFAWSWFNHIGNREMYMNCAPVTITGGSASYSPPAAPSSSPPSNSSSSSSPFSNGTTTSFLDTLPPIFVANVPGFSNCTTTPGSHILNIPNPGAAGVMLEQPDTGDFGNCPAATGLPNFPTTFPAVPAATASSSSSSSSGSSSSSSSIAAGTSSSTTSSISGTSTTTSSSTGTSATSTTASTLSKPSTMQTVTTSETSSTASSTISMPAPPGVMPSPYLNATACSPDGSFVCMGPNFFGICDHGYAVKQPVAPGTACENGHITYAKPGNKE